MALRGKEFTCQCKKHRFDPWVGKVPWRRKWQPTSVLLPGKSHGQSLVGYGPWSCKESNITEHTQGKTQLCTKTYMWLSLVIMNDFWFFFHFPSFLQWFHAFKMRTVKTFSFNIYVNLLAKPHGMRDLSSQTRDRTLAPWAAAWCLNHWISKEAPFFKKRFFN